jgi:hypothetical protein
MKLPALTIWQPWATLVIADCKPYEFRTWPAPRHLWGKRIAIHAAARLPGCVAVLRQATRIVSQGRDQYGFHIGS